MSDSDTQTATALTEAQEAHSEGGLRTEAAVREKITKKASVVFERKDSDGSSFWSLSARNSVASMFESGAENTEEAETEAPRKILQKKRSSLCRQPDIEKVLEAAPVHEFQKVMSGLKRVEDQKMEMKKSPSTTSLDPSQTASKEVSETAGAGAGGGKNQDRNGNGSVKRNSSDKKASDLNSKLKEDKSSSALKKKQMNKTGGKTPTASSRPVAPPNTSRGEVKKQPLKAQQSAPARTSSLKTKKEANSESSPVKSLGQEGKKVKPDTIAAHKNPTSSRSSSPSAADKKEKRPASRSLSLRTRPETSASLRKQTSKPELGRPKSGGKTGPGKAAAGKSEGRKKEEKEEQNNSASPQKIPPTEPPKPSQPVKKKSFGRSEAKKVPPPVAPKPGQKRLDLKLPPHVDRLTSKSKEPKPVVKKLATKTSLAELARLADSSALEIVVRETVHQTQFVSQAQAVLSPSPSRKIRSVNAPLADQSDTETLEQDQVEVEDEEEEEGGIISESVSASSVIQMFGGIGKFKKTASSEKARVQSPTEDKTVPVPVAELKKSESRKNSSEKTARKQSNTTSGARKPSTDIRTKKASSTGGTGSAAPPRKKSSSVSAPAVVVASKKSVPRKESKQSPAKPSEEEPASSTNVVKTTMTVRLHPGNVEEQVEEQLEAEQLREEEPAPVPGKGGESESLCANSVAVCSGPDKTRQ